MIQFSCDRCKRVLDPNLDLRYVVKIEVQVALEPAALLDDEEDRDHLAEIEEQLEVAEQPGRPPVSDEAFQQIRYDLCCDCFQRYIQNPLGFESPAQLGFSPN